MGQDLSPDCCKSRMRRRDHGYAAARAALLSGLDYRVLNAAMHRRRCYWEFRRHWPRWHTHRTVLQSPMSSA